MWNIEKLSLSNFISHKESEMTMTSGQATLVYGVNKTDKGQESNGSGKSAILEGITVGMLGEPLRKVSLKELVKTGTTEAKVVLEMRNEALDETVVITRKLYSNTKPSEIDITLNGAPLQDISRNGEEKYDVRQANAWILKRLEISKEDLLNYFLVSKKKFKSFFSQGDTAKKAVIGRFSQSNLVDGVFDIITEEIKSLELAIDASKRLIEVDNGKIEVYQEQIDNFSIKELEDRRVNKLTEISTKMKSAQAILTPLKELYNTQQKQVNLLKEELSKVPEVQVDNSKDETILNKHKQTLQEYKTELDEFNADRKKVLLKLSQYEKNLLGVIQCPECTHEWNPGNQVDVVVERKNKIKAEGIIVEIDEDITAVDTDITNTNAEIVGVNNRIILADAKLVERRKAVRGLEQLISDKEKDVIDTDRRIAYQQGEIDRGNDEWHLVSDAVITDPTTDLQKKIDEINVQNEGYIKAIELNETAVFDKKQWSGNFLKFKTYLSNKTIGVIQAHCNEYLGRVGTDLSLLIEGYKINRDKSVREDITTHVLRDGVNEGVIDKFSGGEEARILVSMILTQQKLINMSCENGGLDLCFLDEIIESVDSQGILGLMNALNSLEQTIVVITHGTFNQEHTNILQVTKTNGNSTIDT